MMQSEECERNGDNLILTGFMGSGKTSVGIRLSYLLKRPFVDTDKMIEEREDRSISAIFAQEGESAFREKETALLLELSISLKGKILSVGGGTPLRRENRRLLKQMGTVIYLRIQPKTVYERLQGDDTRPLLACDDPLERITVLLEQRRAIYEDGADIIVDVDGLDTEDVAATIMEKLNAERRML